MEGSRMRKHAHSSPERSKARSELPSKSHHPPPHHHHSQQQQHSQQARRVPVVYYLCRNQHLEPPHIIEVPTSSAEGLCLRDVINRLNVLRGKGMAAMYSWSCKRSYKNGFVWHDLCADDLIFPINGNEYVLKGSELLDTSPSDRPSQPATVNSRLQASSRRPLQEPASPSSSRSQEGSPSSLAIGIPEVKGPPPQLFQPPVPPVLPPLPAPAPSDDLSPQDISPTTKSSPSLGAGGYSPSASGYRVHTAFGAIDASTQTEEGEGTSRRTRQPRATRTMAVATEEGSPELVELEDHGRNRTTKTPPRPKTSSEISRDGNSPPPTSSPSSGGKTETLESLIRAEVQKMNSFRILEEEEVLSHTGPKLRASNMFMQLITCGSLSVKGHHSFGFVPTYKARFSQANYPSPAYSNSVMMGELGYPLKNSRLMGKKKECYSGSMVDTRKHKEGGQEHMPTAQHQSPYNAERSLKSSDLVEDKGHLSDSARPKRLHRRAKAGARKQPKAEIGATHALSDRDSISSSAELPRYHQCSSLDSPAKGCSRRAVVVADAPSIAKASSSMRLESFQRDMDKVIKIDERLTSGARVIIQSTAPCEDSEDSSSP